MQKNYRAYIPYLQKRKPSAEADSFPETKYRGLLFKELNSIVVRNVAYDFAYEFDIVRIFAVFEDIAEEVAQNSSEILVAGIG